MSKIKSINEYSARLLEISQLINPHHGSRGNTTNVKTQRKKDPVPQLDDEAGKNIESVRVKLLEGKNISQVEVNLINSALASWHQSRQANNKTASLIFNILSGVISLGFFHLGYLIAKLFNKSLPTNPSKEIFKVFRSYKAMLKVESFLKETKGFKVGMPGQSFNLVTQSLEPSNAKSFADFRVNTQGLDDIFKQVQEEDSQSTVEEGVDVQSGSEEANYDMPLNDQNFGFNNFL